MIRDAIVKALKATTGSEDIRLYNPSISEHGDYATNVALTLAKRLKKSPRELAEDIREKLIKDIKLMKLIKEIQIAGPGFINFWISDDVLAEVIARTTEVPQEAGRRGVVEYSSPNIAKPFGIGHFRSTIIGDAVANLLEATGWEVHRDNHLGDWGTQFGKQIYAIKAWSNVDSIEKSRNPVKVLVDLYVKFHEESRGDLSLEKKAREEFKKLEEGDEENRKIWQFCVDVSLKEFRRVYDMLGIKFTENDGVGYGESYFEAMMQPVINELIQKGLLKEGEDGAKLVFFPEDKYPPFMIVKKDATTLYATRDLATDKFRLDKYGADVVIINEVGAEQSLYFQQLFEVERMLGWVKEGQRVHIKHGLFKLKDKKMSTRKGDIVWLEEVIDEAIKKAKKLGSDKKLAKKVAIGALKWNELKRDPLADIVFDWDEVLNMEGNSGPYLQYTYARASSILEKSLPEKETISWPFDHSERKVARVLIHYPEIVKDAANFYSPHILATYLFNLAQTFNSFYNAERVIGHERERTRLLLTRAMGSVIKNGLNLLGIEAPEKM